MKELGRKEGGGGMGNIQKMMEVLPNFKLKEQSNLRRRRKRRKKRRRMKKRRTRKTLRHNIYTFSLNPRSFNQSFNNLSSKSVNLMNTLQMPASRLLGVMELSNNNLPNQLMSTLNLWKPVL